MVKLTTNLLYNGFIHLRFPESVISLGITKYLYILIFPFLWICQLDFIDFLTRPPGYPKVEFIYKVGIANRISFLEIASCN